MKQVSIGFGLHRPAKFRRRPQLLWACGACLMPDPDVSAVRAMLPPSSKLAGYWLGVAWTLPDGTVRQARSPVFEISVLTEDVRG